MGAAIHVWGQEVCEKPLYILLIYVVNWKLHKKIKSNKKYMSSKFYEEKNEVMNS